jgi:hypothetical protein
MMTSARRNAHGVRARREPRRQLAFEPLLSPAVVVARNEFEERFRMKQGWISETVDRLVADAVRGDEGVLDRLQVFLTEDYPREVGEHMNPADASRLWGQINALLGAAESAGRAHVEAAANEARDRALSELKAKGA